MRTPLYLPRDMRHVRAKRALWTEFKDTKASLLANVKSTTARLWMWSRSSRMRSPVMSGWTLRIIRLRLPPVEILAATCDGRMN